MKRDGWIEVVDDAVRAMKKAEAVGFPVKLTPIHGVGSPYVVKVRADFSVNFAQAIDRSPVARVRIERYVSG